MREHLVAEFTDHFGFDKNQREGNGACNSRNGKFRKRLKGANGDIKLETPRDRLDIFGSQIVKEGLSGVSQMDEQILLLYFKDHEPMRYRSHHP